jgi:outer membrane biosynthesis protein TonB
MTDRKSIIEIARQALTAFYPKPETKPEPKQGPKSKTKPAGGSKSDAPPLAKPKPEPEPSPVPAKEPKPEPEAKRELASKPETSTDVKRRYTQDCTREEAMSDTIASLRRKISSAGDLQSVVRTMKALAASSIGQYEKIGECFGRLLPDRGTRVGRMLSEA